MKQNGHQTDSNYLHDGSGTSSPTASAPSPPVMINGSTQVEESSNIGLIVGLVVGIFICMLFTMLLLYKRRKSKSGDARNELSEDGEEQDIHTKVDEEDRVHESVELPNPTSAAPAVVVANEQNLYESL